MKIPKIKFEVMTLEENIELVKWAYFAGNGALSVHDYTIKSFPELANIDKDLSQEEVNKIIEDVVSRAYNKHKEEIISAIDMYSELWNSYNDRYFLVLSKYLKVEWPSSHKIIVAKVGLTPVFPRYLDEFSFSISPNINKFKLWEACAHETLHFLWFEKWKIMHPETPRCEFDSPYMVWQYSEMVTDPILNNEPFKDMFEFDEHGYDSFYKLYDGEELVMDKLRRIYGEDITIEEKIDKGFEYVKDILEIKNRIK